MWSIVYNLALFPVARFLALIVSLINEKARESLGVKDGLWGRLESALKDRDRTRPLVWLHATSVGEYLVSRPVVEKLSANDVDCVITYSSVSMKKWLDRTSDNKTEGVISIDAMPLDSVSDIRRWLDRVRPDAVVFVIYDLWPNAIWQTHKRGIPLYLLSANIKPNSLRYKSILGRSLYRELYRCFSGIFAISESVRDRFLKTNPALTTVEVFGDTKIESALDRRDQIPKPALPDFLKGKTVFIAGSTWPADEAIIFPLLESALEKWSDLVLIVAPHEPTEAHLENTETFFRNRRVVRLSQARVPDEQPFDILLIDSIGILSSLYKVGHLAYVGGGYTTGVHNVLEPSVNGLPTIFGPRYHNAPEAVSLVESNLAFPVSSSVEFHEAISRFLSDPEDINRIGQSLMGMIEKQRGASDKCSRVILNAIRRE